MNNIKSFIYANYKIVVGIIIGILVTVPIGYISANNTFLNSQSSPEDEPTPAGIIQLEGTSNLNKTKADEEKSNDRVEESSPAQSNTSKPQNNYQSESTVESEPNPDNVFNTEPVIESSCNQALLDAYKSQRDAQIASEESYHQSEVTRIKKYYAGRGLGDSSYMYNAINQENARYEAAIAEINAEYEVKAAGTEC